MSEEPNVLDHVEILPGASYADPPVQEDTTREEERIAATAALVEAENAGALSEDEVGLLNAAQAAPATTEPVESTFTVDDEDGTPVLAATEASDEVGEDRTSG